MDISIYGIEYMLILQGYVLISFTAITHISLIVEELPTLLVQITKRTSKGVTKLYSVFLK